MTSPYGSWKSPILPELIVSGSVSLGQIALDGEDIFWVEQRPQEGGRNVIVRRSLEGEISDVTPAPFNARTRVHEYGGGTFAVSRSVVYFSNYADQRLYRQDPGQAPYSITPANQRRYADFAIDEGRGRIVGVIEDHPDPGQEPVNAIASLDTRGDGEVQVLAQGNDFYAAPRLSPDGTYLAWLTWNHPNMPWDGCELWVAQVGDDGSLTDAARVAGEEGESIFQPQWSPGGVLYFVSDSTGWWNLYRWQDHKVSPVLLMEAEFGKPHWVFGAATYGFQSDDTIICAYCRQGVWGLGRLAVSAGELTPLDLSYTEMGRGDLKVSPTGPLPLSGKVVFEAGSPSEPMSLLLLDPDANHLEVLRRSTTVPVDPGYLSAPQPLEFPTQNGRGAHAFYYPPRNRDYAAPSGEAPPLLVKTHGGPTGATSTSLDLQLQYWTSRGFAVLDVNYGGSTGYGREYRQRLEGNWGVVDVDDCISGALYLVNQGLANPQRLAIAGGSAGGYTTLAVLTFRDVFQAGASYYGVSDLEALARDTHKFESRYLDRLVGPYPQRRDLYHQRSPINFTHQLTCALILFQGLEDKIVPPSQAEQMYEAVRRKGLPTAYLAFAGEQHGFRDARNIQSTLEAELYFYSRVFGFELADPVEPVPIENM
jgi:dipeptidyl aminopeptidase/acylaminoacyl peptidase